jgi:hypothetical protein
VRSGLLPCERNNADQGSQSVTDHSITGAGRSAHAITAAWRSLELGAHGLFARFRAASCDECSHPIRWWNRRVWVASREQCAHLQCWNGRLFLKRYVQLMSEEIRQAAQRRRRPPAKSSADAELRELRLFARALRERVERVEAQLQQAEELAARTPINAVRNKSKVSTPI